MDKIAIFCALILIGLFVVFVINNNITKPKLAAQQALFSPPSKNLSPSPVQSANLNPSPTSSLSSETKKSTAIIKTEKGDIELTLYPNEAPKTVANFIAKAKSGFYNNLVFHRVEDWVIQGGDPLGNGTGGGNMPTELNNKPFVVGSLGVARGPDIKVSNDSQFFITKTDASWLNNQYTNFGIVINSMDIVKKIEIGDKILDVTAE